MIIEQAIDVLRIEAEGILQLIDTIGASFEQMVELVYGAKGRLIVSGIGKSGIVGRKIVATLTSTGTRSLFLHPVEAMHGDLGMVGPDDVFLALSNSGETDELNILLPAIRSIGCRIIAFTGNPASTLAKNADLVIDTCVRKEACPLGLAPTASTTAQLAMGDALAVVLINKRQFNSNDFKKIHPGGVLGHRLSRNVGDIMLSGSSLPLAGEDTPMVEALNTIDRYRLGALLVVTKTNRLAGIITDGDIRRMLVAGKPVNQMTAGEVMTADPKRVSPESPAYDALNLMERHQITVLPVTGDQAEVLGILHLHEILGKGAFTFNGS